MSNRDERFIEKFNSAKNQFQISSISEITSIKFRSNTNNDIYRELIFDYLQMEQGVKVIPAQGNYFGKGWLVENSSKTRVIIIEHETGLEILYIAGSIASLIGLVPLVYSGWKLVKNGRHRFPDNMDYESKIEVRKLGDDNSLIEQKVPSLESFIIIENIRKIDSLQERITKLEVELEKLKNIRTIQRSTEKKKKEKTK